MFAAHRSLLNATVRHWLPPVRDIFGNDGLTGFTEHPARVTYGPGKVLGRASGENMPDARATVWLFDHPRPVAIGATFELDDGETLKAIRIERRTLGVRTITKVYLS
jgi:hypothetical protein